MNKEEIKSLISAKIAGQGNQVDAGGALDEILNAIVDAIPESGSGDGLIVKRFEKSYPEPQDINPISSSVPFRLKIPMADLGLDENYELVSIKRVATALNATSDPSMWAPGTVIVIDSWVTTNGESLALTLVSARTTPRTLYGISFNAYFIKKQG